MDEFTSKWRINHVKIVVDDVVLEGATDDRKRAHH